MEFGRVDLQPLPSPSPHAQLGERDAHRAVWRFTTRERCEPTLEKLPHDAALRKRSLWIHFPLCTPFCLFYLESTLIGNCRNAQHHKSGNNQTYECPHLCSTHSFLRCLYLKNVCSQPETFTFDQIEKLNY